MKVSKRLLIIVFLIIIAFCAWHWNMLLYGINQGKGQLHIILNARPVDEFIADPEFPDSLKQKLLLAKAIRLFAIDSLQLHNSDNYTKLYDQQGQVLLWNVSACEPYALQAYQWDYPFLGSMPYKGFFELEKAQTEATALKDQGYDIRVRPVDGWSTLGMLEDPLLSNMLEGSDGSLAEVIIHELTHATIFVKNKVDFNENLASFVGELGAERFLISHFGDSSAQHLEYLHEKTDGKVLTHLILAGAKKLDSLYGTFDPEWPTEKKDSLKHATLLEIKEALDTTSFYNQKYHRIFDKNLPNNAYFMAFKRYHDQEDSLRMIYNSYDQDFLRMLTSLKEKYGK